jgi:hypothetical protein
MSGTTRGVGCRDASNESSESYSSMICGFGLEEGAVDRALVFADFLTGSKIMRVIAVKTDKWMKERTTS